MAAATEWKTVERRKVWAQPITASGLRRADAEHPRMAPRTEKPKEEFPALGAARPQQKAPVLNFKAMATDATARFSREEAGRAAAEAHRLAEEARMGRYVSQAELAHRSRLAAIPNRCYDGGYEEYVPPEDEDYEADGYNYSASYTGRGYDYAENANDEESDEFNAHLAVTKRAGDKSDW